MKHFICSDTVATMVWQQTENALRVVSSEGAHTETGRPDAEWHQLSA